MQYTIYSQHREKVNEIPNCLVKLRCRKEISFITPHWRPIIARTLVLNSASGWQ